MDWARILAYVTGMVDQELLARIEYLAVHGSADKPLSTAGPSHYRSLAGRFCCDAKQLLFGVVVCHPRGLRKATL
jgi:hypothetical protein